MISLNSSPKFSLAYPSALTSNFASTGTSILSEFDLSTLIMVKSSIFTSFPTFLMIYAAYSEEIPSFNN